jgi:PAS domain S-box-containing protein
MTDTLDQILEGLGTGVVAVDTQGEITLLNPAAMAILGLPKNKDFLNRPVLQVLTEVSDLSNALANGTVIADQEKRITRPNGTQVPLRYSTRCLYDKAGNVSGAVETFEDISKLQELSRQASRVSTLTALGEMAATVAHEIRNPLGGIGGFAGLLERDLAVDDPRRRLVKKIMEGVASLNRMVTNLLNYTRPLQLNLRPVDFVEVVEDSIGFFEIDAGNRLEEIELQREFVPKTLPCRTDPEQIQQIVLNLLHNAVQAMPQGGSVQIGVAEVDPSENRATVLDMPCITLTVSDSGIGMSEDVKSKLFMPFFTTKEDGNGLGLATAKKVIEAHGGDIMVKSAPNEGATFTIFLPK